VNERSNRISKLLQDQKSRASYIKAKLAVLVPAQIKALRLKSDMPRQLDLAREAHMHQSRISMFETPGQANLTLETLAKLAATFKTGLLVKFVPLSEMLRWENEFSQDEFDVIRLEDDEAFLSPTIVPVRGISGTFNAITGCLAAAQGTVSIEGAAQSGTLLPMPTQDWESPASFLTHYSDQNYGGIRAFNAVNAARQAQNRQVA
jgi:transcriptional regulator with XRE-family HTH domain